MFFPLLLSGKTTITTITTGKNLTSSGSSTTVQTMTTTSTTPTTVSTNLRQRLTKVSKQFSGQPGAPGNIENVRHYFRTRRVTQARLKLNDTYNANNINPKYYIPYSRENKQCLFKTHTIFGRAYFRAFSKFILYFGQFQCIQSIFMAQIYL